TPKKLHVGFVDVQRRRVVLGHEVRAKPSRRALNPDGVMGHVEAGCRPEKHRRLMQRTTVAQIDDVDSAKTEGRHVWRGPQFADAAAHHPVPPYVLAVLIV